MRERRVFCPCYQCRPAGMTLPAAIRLCNQRAGIARYGEEGFAQREAEKRERLEALKARADTKGRKKAVSRAE